MLEEKQIADPTPQITQKISSILNIGGWVGEMNKKTEAEKYHMMQELYKNGPKQIDIDKYDEENCTYSDEIWEFMNDDEIPFQ